VSRQKELTGIIGYPDFEAIAQRRLRRKMNLVDDAEVTEDKLNQESERLAQRAKEFEILHKSSNIRYCIEYHPLKGFQLSDSKRAIHQHYAPMSHEDLAFEIIRRARVGVKEACIAVDLLADDEAFASLYARVESGEVTPPAQPLGFRKLDSTQRHHQSLLIGLDKVATITGNIMVDDKNSKNIAFLSRDELARKHQDRNLALETGYEVAMRELKFVRNELAELLTDYRESPRPEGRGFQFLRRVQAPRLYGLGA
jgi:hypothetical protein